MERAILEGDLNSAEYRHGVQQGFWGLERRDGSDLYFWMPAKGGRQFLLHLNCTDYWDDAILGRFVDPETHACINTAWPQGDATFEQWVKFKEASPFICSEFDRQGLAHHPDWRGRRAWQKTNNPLVRYLRFVNELLRLPARGYLPNMQQA